MDIARYVSILFIVRCEDTMRDRLLTIIYWIDNVSTVEIFMTKYEKSIGNLFFAESLILSKTYQPTSFCSYEDIYIGEIYRNDIEK